MIHPNECVCPICGLVLPSRAAYSHHYERKHQGKRERTGSYQNGCPILDEEPGQ